MMTRKRGTFRGFFDSSVDVNRVIVLLWLMVVLGLLSLLVPAGVKLNENDVSGALVVIGSGLFMVGASTVFGSALGFLFGVPRRWEDGPPSNSGQQQRHSEGGYKPNTNLEQISDWLTKIIVGVGLIQLPEIVEFFDQLGNIAGPAFGPPPSGGIIAISLVVHYLVVGFFQGFLLAYLWLPGAFARAAKQLRDAERGNSEAERVEIEGGSQDRPAEPPT